jgi:hypothetical protein
MFDGLPLHTEVTLDRPVTLLVQPLEDRIRADCSASSPATGAGGSSGVLRARLSVAGVVARPHR